ncbi:MAG: S26 family signal peptidase [Planctomycetaceae bacterium]|nr:MAG: S26 family signal peptidase [Planctomycetaceae bacterium]
MILTGSMAPNIEAGDIVLSSPDPDPELMLGRVVVFEDPGKPKQVLTHRVIGFNADGHYVTPEPLGPGGAPYPAMYGKPDKASLDAMVQQTAIYFRERENELLA